MRVNMIKLEIEIRIYLYFFLSFCVRIEDLPVHRPSLTDQPHSTFFMDKKTTNNNNNNTTRESKEKYKIRFSLLSICSEK